MSDRQHLGAMLRKITFLTYVDEEEGEEGPCCPYCHLIFESESKSKRPEFHSPHCEWRTAVHYFNISKGKSEAAV